VKQLFDCAERLPCVAWALISYDIAKEYQPSEAKPLGGNCQVWQFGMPYRTV